MSPCTLERTRDRTAPKDRRQGVCYETRGSPLRRQCRLIWVNKKTEHRSGGPGWVSAQAMATASGLAALEKSAHLLLHPELGPWLSLRSVLIFDHVRAPFAAPPPAVPLELSAAARERLQQRLEERDSGTECLPPL